MCPVETKGGSTVTAIDLASACVPSGVHGRSGAEWDVEVADERGLRLQRILLRTDTQAQLGAGVRDNRVDRPVDGQSIEARDRHGGSRPDAPAQTARAEERNTRFDLGEAWLTVRLFYCVM